jgi:small subunit ribosomal protein S8
MSGFPVFIKQVNKKIVVTNALSDTYSRIKNGYKLNSVSVFALKSKKVVGMLDILLLEGFIRGYSFNPLEQNKIKILLKYTSEGHCSLQVIKGISRAGYKVYVTNEDLWNIHLKSSTSCFILSTSKGVISSKQALKYNLGGELLCYVF